MKIDTYTLMHGNLFVQKPKTIYKKLWNVGNFHADHRHSPTYFSSPPLPVTPILETAAPMRGSLAVGMGPPGGPRMQGPPGFGGGPPQMHHHHHNHHQGGQIGGPRFQGQPGQWNGPPRPNGPPGGPNMGPMRPGGPPPGPQGPPRPPMVCFNIYY